MALKKIIKVEDPDDIKSGYAGKVMESVKFAALIASFTGFVVGIILKTRLTEFGSASWSSDAFTLAIFFIVLFLGLWFTVKDLPALCREKTNFKNAGNVADVTVAGFVFLQYAVSFSFCFFFAVTVDAATNFINPLFAGDYLLDFPAAVFFFYGVVPAVLVNLIAAAFMRSQIRKKRRRLPMSSGGFLD